MTSISVIVTGAQLVVQVDGPVTCGMVGLPVQFSFDESWDGLIKTAVFRAGGLTMDAVNIQEKTLLPWEVLEKKSCTLHIGVYGTNADGTLVMPTVWAEAAVIQPGADPTGDESAVPTQNVYQQILAMEQEAVNTAQSVRQDADAGMFDGEKGDKGDPGEKGDTGDIGPIGPQGPKGDPFTYEDFTPEQLAELKADSIVVEVSGQQITVSDSSNHAIQALTLYGKSSQDGTPTPDAPVQIQSVGAGGSVKVTATDGANQTQTVMVTDGLPLRGIPVSSGGNVTVNGQQYIADTLEVYADGTGQVIKRIGVYTPATDDFISVHEDGDRVRFSINDLNDTAIVIPSRLANYMCNLLPYTETPTGECIEGSTSILLTRMWIWVNKARIGGADKASFVTWAAENDLQVLYAKAAPETIPLTAQQIQTVLELRSFKPVTNFCNSDDTMQSIKYIADPKAYIDNKLAELTAALLSQGANI